ncbi:hypothetical protein NE237_028559 [Protea cynaroides]|uniref:Uncharacterized protein n=1 Tax=Protea cynaroides TaxID=273540 RepID=A0A9Q0GPK4_9MAGN|nr:hypothetical protein NE237_028559 [Protea cynaroides]
MSRDKILTFCSFEPRMPSFSSVTRSILTNNPLSIQSRPASFVSPLTTLQIDDQFIKPVAFHASSFSPLLLLNSPKWKKGVIASLSAMVFGSVKPIYALTIGGMISAFFLLNHDQMRAHIRTYALIFCSLSLVSIIFNLSQHYNFVTWVSN